jgi:trimethylamine-N-oxide reductase (cytochrome c), cytochrome c-type subunit TorC
LTVRSVALAARAIAGADIAVKIAMQIGNGVDDVNLSMRSLLKSACLIGFLALAPAAQAADSAQAVSEAAGSFPAGTATVYAIATLPVGASPGGPPIAKISPSTPATVLAVEGENLKVRIGGWQQGSGGRLVFFAPGRRILVAEVDADQKELLRRGATQTDTTTGQEWSEVSFEGYAARKQFVGNADLLWRYANELMDVNCTTCHARHPVDHFTANQWAGVIRTKKDRVSASADQLALMGQYVQKHASDMAK